MSLRHFPSKLSSSDSRPKAPKAERTSLHLRPCLPVFARVRPCIVPCPTRPKGPTGQTGQTGTILSQSSIVSRKSSIPTPASPFSCGLLSGMDSYNPEPAARAAAMLWLALRHGLVTTAIDEAMMNLLWLALRHGLVTIPTFRVVMACSCGLLSGMD